MPDSLTPATLAFRDDGTPYSVLHDDIYHSAAGGLAQARHVFLDGNQLPQRWHGRAAYTVLETGFGMGINFLMTWMAWRNDPARCETLHFVSIEKYPIKINDLRRAHANVLNDAETVARANELADAWPAPEAGSHELRFDDGQVRLTLVFADAAEALGTLDLHADAFYLDGFAPSKNPELWSDALFASLARIGGDGATFATYTSAGTVKRALRAAGFECRRARGFGWKRHMLVGRFVGRPVQAVKTTASAP